jgi:uncharacterized protein (TIGR04255 family)
MFKGELPTKFLRKLAAESETNRVGHGFNSLQWREGHEIQLGGGKSAGNKGTHQLFGWDWQRLSAGNVPVETLVLEDKNLIYETVDYSSWSEFSMRFEEVALPILEDVLGLVDISNLILEYIDRFVYDGPASEARAVGVLADEFAGLPEAARNSSVAWHSHFGWFEEIDGHSLLINQNIDTQDGQAENDGATTRSIQVYTKTDLRPNENADGYGDLRPVINEMHNRSKKLVSDVLTTEMRVRIGMEDAKNV